MVHSLYDTGLRGIFVQNQMCPGLMIVAQKAADYVSEMGLAKHDHMIETLSTQGPDYPFHVGRLPWTAWCCNNLFDVERLHLVLKYQSVNSIPVMDEVARGFSIIKRLNQLQCSPVSGRMFGHVEVHDLTAIMSENDEDEQYPKGGGRDGEKVDRYKVPNVVVQK
jgi:hypothetical protein